MKRMTCSLIQVQKVFNEYADKIAECHFANCGLFYYSVKILNGRTIEIIFYDCCKNDYIMISLVELFLDLGGVDVDWDIFNEPITIY